MPAQKASWCWHFFENTAGGGMRCIVRLGADGAGKHCHKSYPSANAHNAKHHLLAVHGLDEEHPKVKALTTPTMTQKKLVLERTQWTQPELEVLACAEGLHAFSWMEKPYFRKAFSPRMLSAETLRKETVAMVSKVMDLAFAEIQEPVTVAFDSGTVWHRYISFVLVAPKRGAFLLKTVEVDEQTLSAAYVSNLLADVVDELWTKHAIVAAAAVADNAANFQRVCVPGHTAASRTASNWC